MEKGKESFPAGLMLQFLKTKKSKFSPMDGPDFQRLDMELPINEASYVVIDTELTGLDKKKDSIVSVGAVKMVGGNIKLGNTFYRLVKPGSEMKAKSVVVHEITPAEVEQKPEIEMILPEFLSYFGTDILIGHFLPVDLSFINREMKKLFNAYIKNAVLDTLQIVAWLRWNSSSGNSDTLIPKDLELYEIARSLGVPVQGAHNALTDAFMTAQVFQRLIPQLKEAGIKSIGALLKIGDPFKKMQHPYAVI